MNRILYVVEDKDSHQYRYRVSNIVDALYGRTFVNVILTKEIVLNNVGQYDLVVIERQTAKDAKILKLIHEAHKNGIKVLFDIDDLVFDCRDLRLVARSVREKNIFYWAGYFWGIRRIAKRVDGFLTTNEFLGKKLERSFNKPYKVIRNSLNRKQVEISGECIKKKDEKKPSGFRVGYFSGSPTHVNDFAMVEKELIKFLRLHSDVNLLVVGYMSFSKEMQEMVDAGKVQVQKPVNYLKLQELMAGVDVNIAPLVINDFTNCKSELKFFEAAAVETTTIASPTDAFKKAIKDGENGFLAQPGEWYDKLEYLYNHPEENRRIAKRARGYALKHYYGKEFLKEVEEAYDYFGK